MVEGANRLLMHYSDGEAKWYLDDVDYCVYKLCIGNEFYIGSTCQPRHRFGIHIKTLEKNKHQNDLIQDLFNELGTFSIYLVEECSGTNVMFEREKYYIDALRPTLNLTTYSQHWSLSDCKKNKDNLKLNEVFKLYRLRRDYTFSILSKKSGVSKDLISKFEKGLSDISFSDLLSLCNALKMDLFVKG